MSELKSADLDIEDVKEIQDIEKNTSGLGLEQLTSLVLTDRLHFLEEECANAFQKLQKKQHDLLQLHKLLKLINSNTVTDDDGETYLNISKDSELSKLLEETKDLIDDNTTLLLTSTPFQTMQFEKDQKDRLVDNIRMTIENCNTQNEMQLQTVSRLMDQRHECFQISKSIVKALHDATIHILRGISGR